MGHIEIRDLWLQKEVREGRLKVVKVLGSENPADLMTKILNIGEIEDRLRRMNLIMMRRCNGAMNRLTGREDDDKLWCDQHVMELSGTCEDEEDAGPWICAVEVVDEQNDYHAN